MFKKGIISLMGILVLGTILWMFGIFDSSQSLPPEESLSYKDNKTFNVVTNLEKAERLLQEGNKAYNIFDYTTALKKAEQGLNLARQQNDDVLTVQFLGSLGMIYEKQGHYQKALEDYFQPALATAYKINAQYEMTAQLSNIGRIYYQLGQYQNALDHFQPTLEITRNTGNLLGVVTSLNDIGEVYIKLGKYRQSEDYLWNALTLARKNKAIATYHQARSLGNIGLLYQNLKQYPQTLHYFQQALKIAHKIGHEDMVSFYLGNIGVMYSELKQYQKAEEFLQKAVAIARELRTQHLVATHLNYLGQLYKLWGKVQKAQTALQESVLIQDTLGISSAWKTQRDLAAIIIDLNLHLMQPDTVMSYYEKALDNLEQLRTGLTEKQQKLSFMQEKLFVYDEFITLLQTLHVKHPNKGYERKALEVFERKQGRIFLEEMGQSGAKNFSGIPDDIVQRENELAKQVAQARKRIDTITIDTINEKMKKQIANQMVENTWGELFSTVKSILKERLNSKKPLNNQERRILSSYSDAFQGKSLFGMTVRLDISSFIQQFSAKFDRQGQHFLDSMMVQQVSHADSGIFKRTPKLSLWSSQNSFPNGFIKTGLLNKLDDVLEKLDDAAGQPEKSKREGDSHDSKNNSLENGKTHNPDNKSTLPLLDKEDDKDSSLSSLDIIAPVTIKLLLNNLDLDLLDSFDEQEQQTIIQKTEPIIKTIFTAQEQMRRIQLVNAQQAFKKQLQNDFPNYYTLKYPKPANLIELQKVMRSDELMLVYNVMETNTILWVISQKTVQMFNLPLGESVLNKKITHLRQLMGTDDNLRGAKIRKRKKRESKSDSFAQASHDLYLQLLPAQVRIQLMAPYTIYVVPTGPLYSLPFEVLVTQLPKDSKNTPYLIEDVPIAYLSSASLLKILREAQQRRPDIAPYPFLAFANPVYRHEKTSEVLKTSEVSAIRSEAYRAIRGSYFTPLPETENEAKEIAALLNAPKESEPLQLGEAASRPMVFQLNDKKRLADYQYVLFATHGILPGDMDYITQSALVLSYPDTQGYLTMADVFGLQLNAKLVSLSACNTGGGKKTHGEGVMGLTRAFMYAGTPTIAVTQWSVESHSAKTLSVGFFKHLKNTQKPATALRAIKLRMLRGEEGTKYQKPYYWAPFVVFGDAN